MNICPTCGEWFEPDRKFPWKRFCKEKCRQKASYKRRVERDRKAREATPP